jgi:hypothetical protein
MSHGMRLNSPVVYPRLMTGKAHKAVYSTLISFGLYNFSVRHWTFFGIRQCTFCDLSVDCCSAISHNIEWFEFTSEQVDYSTQVVCSDVLQLLRNPTLCVFQRERPLMSFPLSVVQGSHVS